MPNKPWTQAELNLLLSKKKVSTRSKKSIRMKLIQLGFKKPKYKIKFHKKREWTQEEIKLLKENKDVPNRTKDSIRGMKIRLGITQKSPWSRIPWKKTEEKLLKQLVKQGKSAREIFLMKVLPKYSRNSLQKKMCHMGLAKKEPKQIWTKDELIKFKNFLNQNWEGRTPQEVLELWNSSSSKKTNKSKVLYHLYNLKIKIPYGEVQKINNLRKKENSIKTKFFKNTKSLDETLRLERARLMGERMIKGRDIWTGLPACVGFNDEE